jgi:hypothetical protein
MLAHFNERIFLVACVMGAFHVSLSDAASMRNVLAMYEQGSSITDTMLVLDTNRNGRVDRSEIEAFARSQGFDVQEMAGDFQAVDSNGDGELDVGEISKLLRDIDASHSTAVSTKTEPSVKTPLPVASANLDSSKELDAPAVVAVTPVKPLPMETALKQAPAPSVLEVLKQSNLESLQQNAAQQAGRVVATSFANRAQLLMKQSGTDEKNAALYAKEARALRGKVQELIQSAKDVTRRAALDAATHVASDAVPQVEKMRVEAHKIAQEADHQRTLAKQAMHQAAASQSLMKNLFQTSGSV